MKEKIRISARALIGDEHHLVMCWEKQHKFYFLPGGGLEPGENVQECLVRELQEEMNFEAQIEGFVGCVEHHWQGYDYNFQEFNFVFRVKAPLALLKEPIDSKEPHIAFEVIRLQDLLKMDNVLPTQLLPFLAQYYNKESAYLYGSQLA